MSNITVTSTKRVIQVGRQIRIVKPTARANIKTVGVQGRPGRDGLDGIGSVFEHSQPTASTIWTINHNKNVKPAFITVEDLAGNGLDGFEVEHLNLNQVRLKFNPAAAGTARLL